jgi:hypothetical protein
MTRPIKIGIATVVVVVAFGVGVVAAPVVRPVLFPASTSHLTRGAREALRLPIGRPSLHRVAKNGGVATVKGGATGDGPADQAECDKVAAGMNSWIEGGIDDYKAGDVAQAQKDFDNANALENDGLDEGCFFQYD